MNEFKMSKGKYMRPKNKSKKHDAQWTEKDKEEDTDKQREEVFSKTDTRGESFKLKQEITGNLQEHRIETRNSKQ